MEEANKDQPLEQESGNRKMRTPVFRTEVPVPEEIISQEDLPEKEQMAGVRKPSFTLSVPSRIEDEDEPEEELQEQPELSSSDNVPPEEPPEEPEPPEEDEEEEPAPAGRLKRIWRSRNFSRILVGLSIICFAVGLYFFIKPTIIHKNQEKVGRDILEMLEVRPPEETGEVTIEVNVKDVYMPGSYDDSFDVILPPGVTGDVTVETTAPVTSSKPKTVTITSDTVMKIPSINFESAIAPDVKESTLWVLPGHFPPSAQPGEVGVAAYFGHRMIKRGLHFNRLNEVSVGDRIQIKRLGQTYDFIVDYYKIVEPSEVGSYVYEETDTSRILLVTCDPIIAPRSTKKRILVGGYLEGGVPAP